MPKIEEKPKAIQVNKRYSEKDFIEYKNARTALKDEAKEIGLHPDILYQRNKKYLRLQKRGTNKVTNKPIYEILAFVTLGEDGALIDCPMSEHENFLKQFDEWLMSKSGKDKVRTESLEELTKTLDYGIEVDVPDEDEILINPNI